MKIYIRRIDNQCIKKQISYSTEILKDFLDDKKDHDVILCEGKNSHHQEKVELLLATDPRFSNAIKTVLNAEGQMGIHGQGKVFRTIWKTKGVR